MGHGLQAAGAPALTRQLVYFHGMPGGSAEWRACAPAGASAFAPDRNSPVSTSELSRAIAGEFAQGPVTLVGFSAGAPIALALARELGSRCAALHLVSPAGPLQLGDFLDQMAGGPLFRLAARRPGLFKAVVRLEALLARHAPDFLLGRLLATAQGGDVQLRGDTSFRRPMAQVLRNGIGRDPRGFIAEVIAYTGDWRGRLEGQPAPITIWQGTLDNWTPPAMAQRLTNALPQAQLRLIEGASHYSTLKAALAEICG